MNRLQLINHVNKRIPLKRGRYVLLNMVCEMLQIMERGIPNSLGWYEHTFQTNLGQRIVCCKRFYSEEEFQGVIHLMYWENENSTTPLFTINMSNKSYEYLNYSGISEDNAWLAVQELEKLSYKEIGEI